MAVILNENSIRNLACDAGEDLLGELITVFIDEMGYRKTQVEEACLLYQYQELAHSIKGSALTFGAEALAELAAAIELRAKGGDDLVKEQLPELVACLVETRNRYQGYLDGLDSA
ncbi:Hpt domain-containing protein [Ferrimonas futtsuensis]|uniref:Hpt domain-containing protein n=1 Tax=Ferrimonas futtsuensis TaxID=364764 RepID=UPI000403CBFE|nr:Hpt domain-containing protein [Ferrimonas futtsuensis]